MYLQIGTVSEAVFLLGLERNSAPNKIYGASYAPLLQNLNSFEWTVGLSCPLILRPTD